MRTYYIYREGEPNKVTGFMAVALSASALIMMTPTTASAFDIGGLVHGAIAQYAARYASGGYRSLGTGGHSVSLSSHHSRHSDDDEADATPGSTNTPPARQITDTPPHPPGGSIRMAAQSSDNGRTVTIARSYGEEPAFAPSR